MDMRVEGIRKKGRPRTRCKNVINGDMKEKCNVFNKTS
jgi:hypothetical protein